MGINNQSLMGQPNLPYTDYRIYAGTDAFFELTFLDRNQALSTPTSLTYRLDDLTNALPMIPPTTVVPTGSTYELQLAAALLVMSKASQGSQICQLALTAVLSDGTTANQVGVLELVAVTVPT
jgi:hypothetical protein